MVKKVILVQTEQQQVKDRKVKKGQQVVLGRVVATETKDKKEKLVLQVIQVLQVQTEQTETRDKKDKPEQMAQMETRVKKAK